MGGKSASGDLSLGTVAGSVRLNTVSGDVRIGSVAAGSTSVHSVSGDVEIAVARGTRVYLDISSTTGDTVSELDMSDPSTGGGPDLDLQVNTVSGDIRIVRGPASVDERCVRARLRGRGLHLVRVVPRLRQPVHPRPVRERSLASCTLAASPAHALSDGACNARPYENDSGHGCGAERFISLRWIGGIDVGLTAGQEDDAGDVRGHVLAQDPERRFRDLRSGRPASRRRRPKAPC